MSFVNKVIIIGNIGNKPEIKYMPNGNAVSNLSIATTENWKDKNTGEKKTYTEWHRVVFYNKLAEIVCKFLDKGSQIYLEGRLKTRKWTDKNNIERYVTEIIVINFQMLNSNKNINKKYKKKGINDFLKDKDLDLSKIDNFNKEDFDENNINEDDEEEKKNNKINNLDMPF